MRTQAADPDAAVPGTSGAIKCIARHLPAVTTEYAALWVPLRPPPSPAMPPYDNATLVPYVATILEVEDNPVFQAVVAILVINLLTILYAMRLRITHPNGCLGPGRCSSERGRASRIQDQQHQGRSGCSDRQRRSSRSDRPTCCS